MLWRNLAYTAVTRAARALILVGRTDALRSAARQDRPSHRHTGLAWRLKHTDAEFPAPAGDGGELASDG
jgi:exodeoxyribonuclease V alpha subunit